MKTISCSIGYTGRKEAPMRKTLFDNLIHNLKNLPPCDFPETAKLQELSEGMTLEQLHKYAELLVQKGKANYYYGRISLRNGHLLT